MATNQEENPLCQDWLRRRTSHSKCKRRYALVQPFCLTISENMTNLINIQFLKKNNNLVNVFSRLAREIIAF